MEVTFLPYGMVVYSHAMGEGSTVFYVATCFDIRRSVEAKLSFMSLGSAIASDHLVLAMSSRHS